MHVHAIPGRGVSKSELFAAFGRARAQGWQIQPLGLHEAVLRHPDGREFRLLARGEGKGRKRRRHTRCVLRADRMAPLPLTTH